jgi:hypothetical protein
LNPETPALVADIVLRCIEKDPAERFQSAREIIAALKAGLSG